jgi:Short C-terminal domain
MKRRIVTTTVLCLTCLGFLGTATAAAATSGDDSGGGIPSGFVALIVLGVIVSIGLTVWRVSTARSLARQAGMNPDTATAVTLLGNQGLDAAYLASNLRNSAPHIADYSALTAPARSTADRLTELQSLREQGLITPAEYDARRKAIVEQV